MYDCQSLPVVEMANTSTASLETTTTTTSSSSRSKLVERWLLVPIAIKDK